MPSGQQEPSERASLTLGYRPALDGFRGVAVILVLIGHLAAGRFARSATTGVALFFVLSGFLITQLLLQEWERRRRLSLRHFYLRRAYRLMPALSAVLVLVGVYSRFDRQAAAPILVPALYLSNIALAAGRSLGLFDHLWSLAIEEQFYLVWPVVLALTLRRSRRTAVVVAGVGAVLSMLIAVVLAATDHQGVNWARVRFGPDTRAHALLLGCLIALVPAVRDSRLLRRFAVPAVAFCAIASLQTDGSWLQHIFWRPMVAVAAVVLVVALLATDGRPARIASCPPLVALGRISYGLYLWHFPIYGVLGRRCASWPFAGRAVLQVALSIAVAAVSYVCIERPFLRLKQRHSTVDDDGVPAPAAVS